MPKVKEPPCRQFPHLRLIEASAGSGKTHALSRQYVEYLLSETAPHRQLSNLLAITFTNNAAREMKERILEWLKRLALEPQGGMMDEIQPRLGRDRKALSAAARAMVAAVLEHYTDFQVQTIDSFTNRLARASARELGFRPEFEITTSHSELIDYALALMASEIGPGRDPELTGIMDEFLELLDATGGKYPWDPMAAMRKSFAGLLEIEAKETGQFAFSDQRQAKKRSLQRLAAILAEMKAYAQRHGLVFDGHPKLAEALAKEDAGTILGWTSYGGGRTPIVKDSQESKGKKDLVDGSKAIWAETEEVVAELAVAHALAGYAAYSLPYGRFKEHLETAKRRRGQHHIGDIAKRLAESLSREMVPEIYLKLGARLSHYLIDEFQDTDSAQWRGLTPLLIEALATDGSAFLVGDLKQAIYMFRKADYRIMRGLKQEVEGRTPRRWLPASVADRSQVENLGHNYRSGQVIVEYAEETFRKILPDLIAQGRFGADLSGLTGYRQETCKENLGRGYVEVRHIQKLPREIGDPDQGKSPVRSAILEIVRDVLGRGYGRQDIAILAGTNWELEQAIDWLTQEGIAATSSSGMDIRQRRVVAELVELLRWLHSPIDGVAWASVVVGEVLARAARADGIGWDRGRALELLTAAGQRSAASGYLYGQCRKDENFLPLWERYFEEPYKLSGFYPVYDLLCLAVDRLGVFANFPEEDAAVLKLLEAVSVLESEGRGGLGEVLEAFDQGPDDMFGLELPESMPAVQLMTYFKAKGMGFPVVINLITPLKSKGSEYYYRKQDGAITLYKMNEKVADNAAGHPERLRELKDERDADIEIQALNSLYVACTRPKSELYNLVVLDSPRVSKPPKNPAKKPSNKPTQVPPHQALFPAQVRGEKGAGGGRAEELRPMVVSPPGVSRHSEWLPESAWNRSRFRDASLGSYLHRVLEDIEYLPKDLRPLVEDLLARHQRLAPEADRARAAESICALLGDPRVACWFAERPGRTVEREVEFIARDGRLFRMDRMVRDPGRTTVIDFKTGSQEAMSREKHQAQVREYLGLLQEACPGAEASGVIVYLDRTVAEVRP